MIDPIAAWHAERSCFTRLLALLQAQLEVLANGEVPNYQLMLEIVDYLHERGDQYLHPREDEAFRRMMHSDSERDALLRTLIQDHRVINRAGETLRTLLEEALDDAMSVAEVEAATATYLAFYAGHMAKEGSSRDLMHVDWKSVFEVEPSGLSIHAGGR